MGCCAGPADESLGQSAGHSGTTSMLCAACQLYSRTVLHATHGLDPALRIAQWVSLGCALLAGSRAGPDRAPGHLQVKPVQETSLEVQLMLPILGIHCAVFSELQGHHMLYAAQGASAEHALHEEPCQTSPILLSLAQPDPDQPQI